MIGSIDLNNKTYEQILAEAIAQIPIYSRDWTNYNVSDPGITILENLSAFSALMESEINEIPENIRFKLLELAGFEPKKGKNAYAYIAACKALSDKRYLPAGAKLYAQDICFEFENNTGREIKNLEIKDIKSENIEDAQINRLISREGIKGGVYLNDFVLFLSDIPDKGEKAAIYFEMEKLFWRNPFKAGDENPFAKVKWEINTDKGFKELKVYDDTQCFIDDGYVKFELDEELYNEAKNSKRYMIRVRFEKTDYDIRPRFKRIIGVLTRVIQRDTKSYIAAAKVEENETVIEHAILSDGYPEIYAMTQDEKFIRYFDHGQRGENRYCNIEVTGENSIKVTFNEAAPERVIAVCRDMSVMAYGSLGQLLGYDGQEFMLPPLNKVCTDDFSLLIVEKMPDGDNVCHIAYPDSADMDGEVLYSVLEDKNRIIIHDCGKYEGAQVRLGAYSIYMGDAADMLPNTLLNTDKNDMKFINYAAGEKGHYRESFEELRKRFAGDIKLPVTMVTKEDCIQVVKSVPGLLIHKIGVTADTAGNELCVVVKPNSTQALPKLSDTYISIIKNYLEQYRMLTTRITIKQPEYVPINVNGTIYTKKYLKNSRENIESALRGMLDAVDSDIGFGSRIIFHEIYERLEAMECVSEIANLTIYPDSYRFADVTGLDIKLAANALYYPGNMNIEIVDI